MAKITPVDTGWFAGTGGQIADKSAKPTSWKILMGDDRIADTSKSDPFCAGLTRDKTDAMGNERIRKNGSDTGFFFSNDFSIMQDDDKGSVGALFN